jgi:hypothetical protein
MDGKGRRVRRPIRPGQRKGALLSAELLLVSPATLLVLFGIVEIGMLASSYNELKLASHVGARAGATASTTWVKDSVNQAVEEVLKDSSLKDKVTVVCDDVVEAGTVFRVSIAMDKGQAAPDLLGVLGFSLSGKLEASTAMRKE